MQIELAPGKYVVAVSGGVDSMVLLDVLRQQPDVQLTVAHYDHGIRDQAVEDRKLVQQTAQRWSLPFVYDEGGLGPNASEAVAREARYKFLRTVLKAAGARSIVTAHHQDDLLETAILNMLRGTGRRGLSSLKETAEIRRPLLGIPKTEILAYAQEQGITWHEDETNTDEKYARNYIRLKLLPKFSPADRAAFIKIIEGITATNTELDILLINLLHIQEKGGTLARRWFAGLPHDVAKEIMMSWLRAHNLPGFDKKMIERLVIASKTYKVGKQIDIMEGAVITVQAHVLALDVPER